jgi:hypothetical protein
MMKVVSRASNRLFVGLPLCRDEDWINLTTNFTINVVISANIINLFPNFLKGSVLLSSGLWSLNADFNFLQLGGSLLDQRGEGCPKDDASSRTNSDPQNRAT